MHKIGLAPSRFCRTSDETLTHLFIKCEKTTEFLKNIKTLLKRSINVDSCLDPLTIMFGVICSKQLYLAENVIYVTAKYSILTCARKNRNLNMILPRQIWFSETWNWFS